MKYILLIPILFTSCKTTFTTTNHILNKGFPDNNINNLNRRLSRAVLKHQPALVIIMIGTNDMINPPKMVSFSNYRARLNKLVHKIQEHGADVLLLSPPPVDTAALFARRSRNKFKILPNEKIDSVTSIIRQTASERHCMYLDINGIFRTYHDSAGIKPNLIRNKKNSGRADGVHPTAEGYKLIAESICHYLKAHDKSYQKIICFGDSITFGAYVHGEGTTKGETYPAVLRRLLFAGGDIP